MLYQALTGKLPFFDDPENLASAKISHAPTPVLSVRNSVARDLAALCDGLLQPNPERRPNAGVILHELGESTRKVPIIRELFVGRNQELNALDAAYEAVRDGATITIVVDGPSGVGKSALIRRFLESLRGEALTLHGRCHEREHVPYKGLDAIVDDLATYLMTSKHAARLLRAPSFQLLPRLFPALRPARGRGDRATDSTAPGAEGVPYELRSRIFQAFRELLVEISEHEALVLAIDDVQWADGDTLALLTELLSPPMPPKLLLLCTRRIADDAEFEPLALPGDVRALSLRGLENSDISKLATQLSKDTRLGAERIETLARESRGHPLFLQELVRLHAERSEARSEFRLDDAIWRRVGELGAQERAIVEATAMAALPTPLSIIQDAAGILRNELPALLANLRDTNLVRVTAGPTTRQIELYHDRLRETVLLRLDSAAQRGWHARLADAIAAYEDHDVERLALHYEGAGEAAKAGALYRKAAARASEALAFERAAGLYARSLRLLNPTGDTLAELTKLRAEALFNAGRGAEAGVAFCDAAELCPVDVIELRGRAANAFLASGHFAEGTAVMRKALRGINVYLPKQRLLMFVRLLLLRLILSWRGFELRRRTDAPPKPEDLRRFDVLWLAAVGFAMTDAVVAAWLQAKVTRLALRIGDSKRAALALSGYVISVSTGGLRSHETTRHVLEIARDLSAEAHDAYADAFADAAAGFTAYMVEDWETACEHFERAEQAFRDRCVGVVYELVTARFMLTRAMLQLGRLAELESFALPIIRDAVRRSDRFSIINLRATAGVVLSLVRDDVEQAKLELKEAQQALSTGGFQLQHVYCLVGAVSLALYCDTPEHALSLLDASRKPLRRSLLMRVQSIRVLINHARARVELALAERATDSRSRHLHAARRYALALAGERLPSSSAHAAFIDAACAALENKPEECRRFVEDAIARFDTCGMRLHAAFARRVLAERSSGDEAQRLAREALRYIEEQQIVAPQNMARDVAPGFGTKFQGLLASAR
jgi:tetratricopeptide (TPR) repeat protein